MALASCLVLRSLCLVPVRRAVCLVGRASCPVPRAAPITAMSSLGLEDTLFAMTEIMKEQYISVTRHTFRRLVRTHSTTTKHADTLQPLSKTVFLQVAHDLVPRRE